MNLIKQLWRGELPLVLTYWAYGVGGNIAMKLFLLTLAVAMPVLALPVLLLSLIYSIFISVAIWRSANKYEGNRLWAILAKIAIIFGVLNAFASLANVG